MSCHLHGVEDCPCPAYLIAMGQMDQILERELESLPAAACVPLALQKPQPKLLDLFCCAGGAAMGYHRAGFDVTGVDIKPQPRYPFRFIQGDALEYAETHGHEFDAIHASPPCQAFTSLRSLQKGKEYPNLIPQTRAILEEFGIPFVIENVEGAPLGNSGYLILLCGTMFGLQTPDGSAEIRRHRLFETSFSIPLRPACQHGTAPSLAVCGEGARTAADDSRNRRESLSVTGSGFDSNRQRHAKRRAITITGNTPQTNTIRNVERRTYGVIDARAAMGIDWMTIAGLSQAIPPAYTEFIGRELMRVVLQGDRLGAAAGKSE